jgi:transcriptional regulator with XRE-family HTH domain
MRDAHPDTRDADRNTLELYGRNVALARALAGVKQDELAKELGVDRRHVSHWETGIWEPRPRTRQRIAQFLGQPLGFFYTEHEPEREPDPC